MHIKIFNRTVKRIHRDRAALLTNFESDIHKYFAHDLADRLDFFVKKFNHVCELGCHKQCHVLRRLHDRKFTSSFQTYAMCDLSREMVTQSMKHLPKDLPKQLQIFPLSVDEESLPFADQQFDLIISHLSFHWINDLDGAFAEMKRILKPDGSLTSHIFLGGALYLNERFLNSGVILGTMFGENSMGELNACFAQAEKELDGGVSPHISPMAGGADISSLLLSSGFAMPTVDINHKVKYFPTGMDVMRYLQRMGESNALLERRAFTPRATFKAAAELYEKSFTVPNKGVQATFETVSFLGWNPDLSQPKPLARGTKGKTIEEIIAELDKQDLEALLKENQGLVDQLKQQGLPGLVGSPDKNPSPKPNNPAR